MSRAPLSLDPLVLIPAVALLAFGLVVMTSASADIAHRDYGTSLHYFWRQLVFIALGVASMLVLARLDLRLLPGLWWLFLATAAVLLLAVEIPGLGRTVNGSQRWIDIGIMRFHASDTARVFLLLAMAGWLSLRKGSRGHFWKEMLSMSAVVGAAIALLINQPDYSAAVVLAASAFGMWFLGGVSKRSLVSIGLVATIAFAALVLSSEYRRDRLTSFGDPFGDRYGSGFQQSQSQLAIGSGGIWGTDLGNSVQKMSFLPEAHNDFVFSILAEEFGFVGVVMVMALYLALIMRILRLSQAAHGRGERFAALITAGIGIWLAIQTIMNIGVAIAELPPTGISLPMISYGGTNMVVSLAQLGIVLAVAQLLRTPPPIPANPARAR